MQYLFDVLLGIDQLLMASHLSTPISESCRMTDDSMFCHKLTGLAMIGFDLSSCAVLRISLAEIGVTNDAGID